MRVLDHLNQAVFVLEPDATLRHANAAAHRLLAAADGLTVHAGRLTAGINGDAARLRDLIHAVARQRLGSARRDAARVLPIQRTSGPLPLCATAERLHCEPPGQGSSVLLFVVDPAAPCIAPESVLREGLGLTDQEVKVALAALRLGGLPAAGASLGIALTTARSHLQHVFDKTGTRNQVALAQMLVTLGTLPVRDESGSK